MWSVWQSAFLSLIRSIYELAKTQIDSDGGDIRCPYMVANGVYITTNISSQAKMANIQRLFEAFGFESKDLIFEVRDIPKALKVDIADEKT